MNDDPLKVTWFDRATEVLHNNTWIAILILFAAVGASLGRRRRRPWTGCLLGFFAGPIGWAVLFLLPDRSPKCPECLAPIDPSARKCRHCGSELQPDPRPSASIRG